MDQQRKARTKGRMASVGAVHFLLGSAGRPGPEGTLAGCRQWPGLWGQDPHAAGEWEEPGDHPPSLALRPLWWGLLCCV